MSTNPFRIPIGTSDPADICDGLPLYPGLGTLRAGVSGAQRSEKLIDVSATVLITRLKISAYYSWGVGVCGPAIAFLSRDVEVLRENIDNEGRLTLTFNSGLEMEAGLFVGASIGFGLNLGLQVYLPKRWYTPWTFAWHDAFAVDIGFSVDILALLIELIQFLLSRDSNSSFMPDNQNRLRDTLPDLKKTFGMVDGAGSSSTIERDLSASPKLTLPFNLINYIPGMKSVNQALGKVSGEISAGPSLHLQFPVTFNFDEFTVVGGLDGRTRADYGNVQYKGNQLTATGPTKFDSSEKPSRVTSHVTYQTSFVLGVSVHFKVVVAKFFSFEKNSPSLDLTYLLTGTRESDRAVNVPNSVSTCVEGGLVLAPDMVLIFTGKNGRRTNFETGEMLKGTVTLPEFRSDKVATINLEIEPRVAGFPDSLVVPANSQTASFNFEFKNQCVATGQRNEPSKTAPPSALTPLQSYTVRATLESDSSHPCSDYEVEVPLNVAERFLRCQRDPSHTPPGSAPAWDPLAGATVNANPSLPGGGSKTYVAALSLWFPYLVGEQRVPVPVTFTLLDENRQPHASSEVVIATNEGLLPLKPSATGTVTLATSREANTRYGLMWRSEGPHSGYSNRFFLIVDAGCHYGQTEFWLDVWNWS
jgi:hypothetical protein